MLSIFLRWQPIEAKERQQQRPGKEISEAARNIQEPPVQFEIFADQSTGKLSRPSLGDMGCVGHFKARHRPRQKDRHHQ